jgi:hypothetical protein
MLDPALRASMPAALLASLEEVLRDSIRLAFAAGLAVTVITLAVSFLMIGTVDPGDRRGKS